MPSFERRMRRLVNPVSTGLTRWWCAAGRRQVPVARGDEHPTASGDGIRAFLGVPSPGQWVAPAGSRPGWAWLPEYGAMPNLRDMPWWVRVWYRTPFIDRYAHEWMWWHGGWSRSGPRRPARAAGRRCPRAT